MADASRPNSYVLGGLVFELAVAWILIFIWKIASKYKSKKATLENRYDDILCVQKLIHKCPMPIPWLVQWHVPMFAILIVYMGLILYKIYDHEFFNLSKVEFLENDIYDMPNFLRYLSLASPIVGLAAFSFAIYHASLAVYKIRGLRTYGKLDLKSKKGIDLNPRDTVNYLAQSHAQWYTAEVLDVKENEEVMLRLINTLVPSQSNDMDIIKKVPWKELPQRVQKPIEIKARGPSVSVENEDVTKYTVRRDHANLEWSTTEKEDILLCIIAMPALFIVMACQSTVRSWEYIGCEHLSATDLCPANGEHTKAQVYALYQENFDFANVCQYHVVYLFTRLCWKFMRRTVADAAQKLGVNENEIRSEVSMKLKADAKKKAARRDLTKKSAEDLEKEKMEMISSVIRKQTAKQKKSLKLTTFQGVHWWCVLGILSLVLNFSYQYWWSMHGVYAAPEDMEKLTHFYDTATSNLKKIFTPFTALCIYNMILVCNSPVINESLQGANAKFLGTRLLVLFSQFQFVALSGVQSFCPEPGEHIFIPSKLKPTFQSYVPFAENVCSGLDTDGKVMLMHSSLLTIEALLIVIFNFVAWTHNVDFRTTFLEKDDAQEKSMEEAFEDHELDRMFYLLTTNDGKMNKDKFKEMILGNNALMESLLQQGPSSPSSGGPALPAAPKRYNPLG